MGDEDVAALRLENKRLREALSDLIDEADSLDNLLKNERATCEADYDAPNEVIAKARAALGGESPEELRAAEKQRSRDADAQALESGAKSPEALRRENSHFRHLAHEPIQWDKMEPMTRTRIRGRGTVDWPDHELHGAKVDLISKAPDNKLVLRVQEAQGSYERGARILLPTERFKRDPA